MKLTKKRRIRALAHSVVLGVLYKEVINPTEILPDNDTDVTDEVYKEVERIYDALRTKWVKDK